MTIAQTGSYELTSNLDVRPSNLGALFVGQGAFAEINLNGFGLIGPGTCSATTSGVQCTGLSSQQSGIQTIGFVNVHGGRISGFSSGVRIDGVISTDFTESRLTDLEIYDASSAIVVNPAFNRTQVNLTVSQVKVARAFNICLDFFGSAGTIDVREVRISDCGGSAIRAPTTATLQVSDSTISRAGGTAIAAGEASTIERTTIKEGRAGGIACGRGCRIQENIITENLGTGVDTGFLSQVIENQVDLNAGTAIVALDGSTISRNTIGAVTSSEVQNTGISCTTGCGVFENVVRNSSLPLSIGLSSRYGRNVFSLYPSTAVSGSGVSAGDNLCDGVSC